jgi:hypothetical protein
MPPVNGVGEPCAGEPHARYDGRGLETGRHVLPHRASPRPYNADDRVLCESSLFSQIAWHWASHFV